MLISNICVAGWVGIIYMWTYKNNIIIKGSKFKLTQMYYNHPEVYLNKSELEK